MAVTTTDFIVTTTFDIDIAEAVLRGGRLVGLSAGRCDLKVQLEIRTRILKPVPMPADLVPLDLERHRQIDLPARIQFGTGIALLPPPPEPVFVPIALAAQWPTPQPLYPPLPPPTATPANLHTSVRKGRRRNRN